MAELARVMRFSTAGELTASIAHEINQPLGAIPTNAETADAIPKSQSPDIAALPDIVELKDIVQEFCTMTGAPPKSFERCAVC